MHVYAILALILLGVASGVLSYTPGDPTAGAATTEITQTLRSQALLIRERVVACRLQQMEAGDPWPAVPADTLVSSLQCGGAGLWAGRNARHLPPPPRGFDPWTYARAGGAVTISTRATGGFAAEPPVREGVSALVARFAAGEASVDLGAPTAIVFTYVIKAS